MEGGGGGGLELLVRRGVIDNTHHPSRGPNTPPQSHNTFSKSIAISLSARPLCRNVSGNFVGFARDFLGHSFPQRAANKIHDKIWQLENRNLRRSVLPETDPNICTIFPQSALRSIAEKLSSGGYCTTWGVSQRQCRLLQWRTGPLTQGVFKNHF